MAIDSKDILGFAIERASALNGLWNLYLAVATAVLGIMASGRAFTTSKMLKWTMTVAFTIFAYSNVDAICRLGELRTSLLQLLSSDLYVVKKTLEPATTLEYRVFHLILDALVILAIWFVPWTDGAQEENKRGSGSAREVEEQA